MNEEFEETRVCALSTIDNPFNPFENYDEWQRFDTENGYNSESYLARIVDVNDGMTEEEQNRAVENAIDEILLYNINGMYTKVVKE